MTPPSASSFILIIISLIPLLKFNLVFAKILPTLTTELPEDATLNFTELARKYGHPSETYQVETQDGYLLELYNLPGKGRIPILLMHGFLDSSDTWIIRGEDSLAINLANNGYDVWLGNTRGNRYSCKHTELDSRGRQFWQFSIHELGYYDLPAIIDKVLLETGAEDLTAIGHSQGNAIFYILGSTRPEYNKKVNLLIALAPICFMHHTPSPVSIYLKVSPVLIEISSKLGIYDLLRYDGFANKWFRKFCSHAMFSYTICAKLIIFPIIGFDTPELDAEFFTVLINHMPAGTSWMNFEHFGQIGINKKFARYDYGVSANLREYNSTTPPLYELKKVTMPVALFAGRNDPLSALGDVELLKDHLPNYVDFLVHPRKQFNHGDHVWGAHMKKYLFPYIYETLNRFVNNYP
ncbi:lipase 1-like [Maniola hyperantus]|uniref:lipase 1-like n=1 Tax=Aphantopus hyperantus TaxID=2795564 RepID=UPI002144D462